jgi:C4-dicarboxylate-specific signal transduction histidine kinase
MVSRLQSALLPQAVDKKSLIINDVDKTLLLDADENTLAYVVGSLLSNAVYSTSNSCIRVETALDEKGLRLCVRNNGPFTYNSHMFSLGNIIGAARRIGGDIGLQSEANGGMTVVFSMYHTR